MIASPATFLEKLVLSILPPTMFYHLNVSTFLFYTDLVNALYLEMLFFLFVQFCVYADRLMH